MAADTTTTTADPPTVAVVIFDGTECSSTIPNHSATGEFEIEIQNKAGRPMALIFGTYDTGFTRDDLVAYAAAEDLDLNKRPDFVEVLNIHEVFGTSKRVSFDEDPGRYFTTCISKAPDLMIILDDVSVDG